MRSVRLRLLPWRPRVRSARWDASDALNLVPDVGDGVVAGLVLGLVAVLLLPVLLVLLLFSAEVAVLLLVLPLVMAGQLLGWLPWVLVLRTTDGERRTVEVRGLRPLLEARRYYRSLRV